MNSRLKEKLDEVKKSWIKLEPNSFTPAIDTEIVRVRQTLEFDFDFKLSEEYCDIMRVANGMHFDGASIFAISPLNAQANSIEQANEDLFPQASAGADVFFYGTVDDAYLVWNFRTAQYERIDHQGFDVIESFSDPVDFFISTLNFML